jgi:hypothetical protein
LLAIFVAWLTLLPSSTAAAHSPMASPEAHRQFHLRLLDHRLNRLVDAAIDRSQTLASLVERLEETDIIVHVDRVMTLPRGLRAHIAFAGASGPARYLRIEISRTLNDKDTVATLAHELQHAVEIGDAQEVRSDAGVCALYHRIGDERAWQRYESNEADAIGRQVHVELTEPHQP